MAYVKTFTIEKMYSSPLYSFLTNYPESEHFGQICNLVAIGRENIGDVYRINK